MTERLLPAISACLDWAQTVEEPPTLHIEALVLLLSAHQDVGATDPGDWTVDDVHEVAALVRHRDRLPELFRETWLSWCDHLVTDARLISTETPRRLRAAIENVDLTRPDHAPPDCEAPPEIAVPLLERLGYGETQTPEPPRPHLPTPVADLDIRAGACPTLNLAARLSAWMDPQVLLRPYTEHDALGENDTAEAARALGMSAYTADLRTGQSESGEAGATVQTEPGRGTAAPAGFREFLDSGAPGLFEIRLPSVRA